MIRFRLVRIVLVVAVLIALGVWAFRPQPVPADFAAVQRGPLEVTVEDEGRTRVRDRYVVSAPLPGRMRRIELDEGDPVAGRRTIVAQFEPADPALIDARTRAELQARVRAAEASVGAARAERDRARTDHTFAQAELRRAEKLVEERVISRAEFDLARRQAETLERAVQAAEFAVRTAEHQLEVARASLIQARGERAAGTLIPLYSPIDGVVLRILHESESVVPTGQPLLEIGDLQDLEIVTDLLSSAAVAVEPGQLVHIEQWGGDRSLRGRVRRKEPSGFTKVSALGVEEQRVNVIVDFEDPREAAKVMGDGYRVEVRIVCWQGSDVLKVPTSSLFRHESKWAVYKVEHNLAVRQPVEIGRRNGLEAEVLSGLQPGEQIVVYPSEAIADEVRVRARTP